MEFLNLKIIRISFLLLTLCTNWAHSHGSGTIVDQDLNLSLSEKDALDKFKEIMDPLLEDGNMKREAYLIRWLRAAKLDLTKSKKMMLENIQWRKEFKMETVHEEDWSEFRSLYEYNVDSIDKNGQPILTVPFGQWDFRSAVLSGNRDKMERYFYKLIDEGEILIRQKQNEGKSVTRSKLLVDVEGFNPTFHLCPQCLTLYIAFATAGDFHFPFVFNHNQKTHLNKSAQIVPFNKY